jgi:hypothetical protein
MKAVRLLEYGGQLVLDEVPTPTIARDEILVKIKKYLRQSPGSSEGLRSGTTDTPDRPAVDTWS